MNWQCRTDWQRVSRGRRYAHPLMRVSATGRRIRWIGKTPSTASSEGAAPLGEFARTPELARLEAVLWVAREPLSGRKLAQFTPLADGTQARTLIRQLNQFYDQAGGSFRVELTVGDGSGPGPLRHELRPRRAPRGAGDSPRHRPREALTQGFATVRIGGGRGREMG